MQGKRAHPIGRELIWKEGWWCRDPWGPLASSTAGSQAGQGNAQQPGISDQASGRQPWEAGCCCSVALSCPTLFNPKGCGMPVFPILHHLLELAQTHVHWVGDAIQPSHLLSPPFSCQSFPASESFPMNWLFQWPKYGSFSISSSNEYSGLISFRIDWFDLLAVQGTQEAGANCKPLQKLGSVCWSTLSTLLCSCLEGGKSQAEGWHGAESVLGSIQGKTWKKSLQEWLGPDCRQI